ncbi:universal stress protein [Streptacidiphilus pinicola]|uniref:Universal stress protein n=1 Tax=Streptacidiphilus pinicola TaxID=2219663 RepID=A0A2X0KJB9_9ACTN|nr:universal stress protein [Streptacidiphilus pinicola]RAG86820.1 universal stress protein [Streptacidiphilus pinicola]
MTLPLIVGVDGSDASLAAADWAGHEAAMTGRDVRLLHVRPTDFWTRPQDDRKAETGEYVLQAMTRLAGDLRQAHPGLRVDVETVTGPVDLTLLRTADESGTLVLGTRGNGGFAALTLGSVAQSVAARAQSPVVLVPPRAAAAEPGYRVVVGVDPGGDCRPVLEFALRSAQDHGVVLRAVHAWQPPVPWGAGPVQPGEVERHAIEHQHAVALREAVAFAHTRFPTVETTTAEMSGSPARVLVEEAEKASLLVVGRRRHRPVSALGPVAHAVVHHACCPVAVVPHW